MKRISFRSLLTAVLLAGVLTVPASAQYNLDEIEYVVSDWVTTEDILSTSPTEYLAVASARNLVSGYDILFVAKAGGGMERWQESAGWVQDPVGGFAAGNVYSNLAGHVADQSQAYGANATGGIDRMFLSGSWQAANILGAGTLYSAVGMDRQTGTAILYAAPAAGNVQRWWYNVSSWWTTGNIVSDGTVYNDVVGDPTMNDSMYGVPTDGGIDRAYYPGGPSWTKNDNIVGATETYTSIAADRNAPAGEIILYAGLPGGGVDRWRYNPVGSTWSSVRIIPSGSEFRYTSLSCHDSTANKFVATTRTAYAGTTILIR